MAEAPAEEAVVIDNEAEVVVMPPTPKPGDRWASINDEDPPHDAVVPRDEVVPRP